MPSTVLTTWSSLSLSTVHTLRVRAKNDQIDIWVDGSNVVSLTTPHPALAEAGWTHMLLGQDHNTPDPTSTTIGAVEPGTYFDDLSISPPATATSPYTDCDTVTDSFNRSDAGDGTLGTTDTGQRWASLPIPSYIYIEQPGNNFPAGGTWTTQGGTTDTAQGAFPATNDYYIPFAALQLNGNNQDVTVTARCDQPDALRIRFRTSADYTHGYEAVFNPYTASQLFLFTPVSFAHGGWTVGALGMTA